MVVGAVGFPEFRGHQVDLDLVLGEHLGKILLEVGHVAPLPAHAVFHVDGAQDILDLVSQDDLGLDGFLVVTAPGDEDRQGLLVQLLHGVELGDEVAEAGALDAHGAPPARQAAAETKTEPHGFLGDVPDLNV